jgi:hypothetical protein
VAAHAEIGAELDRFIAFELGPMFVPYGRIPGIDAYARCWRSRLRRGEALVAVSVRRVGPPGHARHRCRPDFLVLTGNDLAIDMVMYGSDYLLGLSTFAPDAFARRDRCGPRATRPSTS